MNFAILRIEKHRTKARLAGALNHAFRERPTPNADPEKLHLNTIVGANSTASALAAVGARIAQVTDNFGATKPVICVEYMVSASPAGMAIKTRAEQDAYLNDAISWINQKHGADNVVCAVIHRDEGTNAHVSAFVVPLVRSPAGTRRRSVIAGTNPDGSKRREIRDYPTPGGVRLSATHYFRDAGALSEMQTDFAARVGALHGFMRGIKGSKRKHERVARGYTLESAADHNPILVPVLPPRSRFSVHLDADRERDQEMIEREFRALEAQRNELAQQLAVAQRVVEQRAKDALSLKRERDELRRERESIQTERQGMLQRAQQAEEAASKWKEWAIALIDRIYHLKSLESVRGLILRTFEALGVDYQLGDSRPERRGRPNGPSN